MHRFPLRLFVLFVASIGPTAWPDNVPAAAQDAAAPGDALFGSTKLVQLHLRMTEQQFADLAPKSAGQFGPPGFGPRRPPVEGAHRNTFGVDFPWSQADLEFEQRTLPSIGVRYKGNYTHMATARALKKSFKLDLNRHVDGQKLDGLTMLNLHCGVSDPTQLRETLAYAIFRDAGVPAPRTAPAELRLTVPGKYDRELVGVYTLTEQVDKGFLKRHFQAGGGMLLKPEGLQGGPGDLGPDWQPYADRYHPEDEPKPAQKARLIEFARLVGSGDDATFERQIGEYLDVDAFLRFIAVNALQSNLDSYLGFGHNYYLYLVPKTNRFVFIPWDLDLSLAAWPAVGTPEQLVELSLLHPHAGPNKLIDRLFALPVHKARYLEIVKELLAGSFTRDKLLAQIDAVEAVMAGPRAAEAEAVAKRQEGRAGPGRPAGPGRAGGPGGGFGFGGQFGQSMPPRRFVDKRLASVAAQLDGRSEGFEPKPFGGGFGGPPGTRPGAPPAKGPSGAGPPAPKP